MSTLPRGSTFGRYTIDGVVASGGMGVVYDATDRQLGRRIALKLIAPAHAANVDYRERFLREASLLASLGDCPSIVPIYDAGEVDGQLYLAMRFLEGPDLGTLIRRDRALSLDRTIEVLGPVAAAIDAAHDAGLVHRDVKPANILFDRNGRVYLTDFGLTKRADSTSGVTRAGQVVGTPGYLAPEQLTGRVTPALASRIDIYALACVLHACLTGSEPFPRDSYERALFAHVSEPPPRVTDRRPDLPAGIDEVVARGLAKDPADRYGRASELVEALRGLAAGDVADRGAGPAIPAEQVETIVNPAAVPAPTAAVPPPQTERRRVELPARGRSSPISPSAGAGVPDTAAARAGALTERLPVMGQYRNGRTDPSSRTLRTAVTLAAGALLLVAVVVLAGNVRDREGTPSSSPVSSRLASTAPTPSDSASPTGSAPASGPTTPAPTDPPRYGTGANVDLLVSRLPDDAGDETTPHAVDRDSCVSGPLISDGAVARVTCDRRDGGTVDYELFQEATALDETLEAEREFYVVTADSGDCAKGFEAHHDWHFDTDAESAIQGYYLCGVGADRLAILIWTTRAPLVLAWITDRDGNLASLHETWMTVGLDPRLP